MSPNIQIYLTHWYRFYSDAVLRMRKVEQLEGVNVIDNLVTRSEIQNVLLGRRIVGIKFERDDDEIRSIVLRIVAEANTIPLQMEPTRFVRIAATQWQALSLSEVDGD